MPVHYDKDPYAILGVSHAASGAEIKRIYRRLARQYHPDLNKDPRAAERMKDINWAYSILGDPQQRTTYDFWRRVAEESTSSPRASQTPAGRAQPWTREASPRPRVAAPGGFGFGTILACWLLYSLISSALRAPADLFSPPSPNWLTQTAQAERLYDFMLTFSSTHQFATPLEQPTESATEVPPSPTFSAFEGDTILAEIVPGTQEWEWIATLLSEYSLTTPTGLSDEVLRVRRTESGDIFVETRNNGAFFIYLDSNLEPVLIPLSITPVP